jgi:DNA invertase Pin-like site-specific DNA recombinase
MRKGKATACAPRTAVAYARYSSAGQRDVSIDQQLADIRAYAEREGYTLVHEYADHAKSGFRNVSARLAFQQMLRDAASGSFDTVIAWKVDRFGRNRRESAQFKGDLADHGVSVVYAMDPIPDGAAGVLTEGMLEAIAEWYSRNLSENVRRGMYDNAEKCLANGAHILGYRPGPDRRYQIYEPEAVTVRRLFQLYSEGLSMASVANQLNQEGLRNIFGKAFTLNMVRNALSNDAYIGVYHWSSYRIPGGMPAIIDNKLWEACQSMRNKTSRHYEDSPVRFHLTGKCFCGCCSSPMVGDSGTSKTGASYYYYSCQSKKSRSGCHKKSVRKEVLEDQVISFIYDRILTGPEMDRIADAVMESQQQMQQESPLPKYESDLKEVTRKIDNINNAIANGIWNSSTGLLLNSLSEQAEQLRAVIAKEKYTSAQLTSRDRIEFFLSRMAKGDRDDPDHRAFLIRTFINSVTVYDDHLRIAINAVEGISTVPIDQLPDPSPGSDSMCLGLPEYTQPNFLPIMVYCLAI